jgi:hypothetical protein
MIVSWTFIIPHFNSIKVYFIAVCSIPFFIIFSDLQVGQFIIFSLIFSIYYTPLLCSGLPTDGSPAQSSGELHVK